jgi:hypothetical protein
MVRKFRKESNIANLLELGFNEWKYECEKGLKLYYKSLKKNGMGWGEVNIIFNFFRNYETEVSQYLGIDYKYSCCFFLNDFYWYS